MKKLFIFLLLFIVSNNIYCQKYKFVTITKLYSYVDSKTNTFEDWHNEESVRIKVSIDLDKKQVIINNRKKEIYYIINAYPSEKRDEYTYYKFDTLTKKEGKKCRVYFITNWDDGNFIIIEFRDVRWLYQIE
jgi:hypothetical protein